MSLNKINCTVSNNKFSNSGPKRMLTIELKQIFAIVFNSTIYWEAHQYIFHIEHPIH